MGKLKIDDDIILGLNDPYERIANAIILQAVKDYVNCGCDNSTPTGYECYNFFYSEWFETLTNISPDYIIKICHQLLENNNNINNVYHVGGRKARGKK